MPKTSNFTDETREEILRRIADGETLRNVCRSKGMPSPTLVRKWVRQDPDGFGKQYALARLDCVHARLDDAHEQIGNIPTYTDESGNVRLDPAGVNQARLYCDMAKWEASKLIPEYNDKIDLNHRGELSLTSLFQQAKAQEDSHDSDA